MGTAISGLLVLISLKNEWVIQKSEGKYVHFPGMLFLFKRYQEGRKHASPGWNHEARQVNPATDLPVAGPYPE
jgi:hypothetical protein